MKKKDAPELYELLRKGELDTSKTKTTKEEVPEGKIEQVAESKTLPLTPPAKTPGTAYTFPKFKNSFTKNTVTPGEKTFTVKYNTIIFLALLVLIGLIFSFTLGVLLGEKKPDKLPSTRLTDSSSKPEKPSPVSRRPSTSRMTPATSSKWGIRLIYYKNDTRGRYMAQRIMTWLKEHKVTNVFKSIEYIRGTEQICVYAGPYASRQTAEKKLPILRSKHRGFRGCDIKKLK